MKTTKPIFICFCLVCLGLFSFAQEEEIAEVDSAVVAAYLEQYQLYMDSVEQAMNYVDSGTVVLGDDLAEINLSNTYKYLNPEQSAFVLTQVWGNPPQEVLGMLFPQGSSIMDTASYAIIISYDESGHIKDEDAADLDYDDLLEEMQEDTEAGNEYRIEEGYEPIELVGWASSPYYDGEEKKLHWAKELKFGEAEVNTLNYNLRVLGRRGYLELNFIGDMGILPLVQNDIPTLMPSVNFKEGNTYFDFDPDLDDVAAYGIGGLIAGKVLAKAGFFALLAKFWKFIAIGAVAAFGALKRFVFGGKEEESSSEAEA